jgi:hypothetical protein
MYITTVHQATSIDALVESMSPGLAPDERNRVATALLKANPGLKGREQLDVGTVLVVPTVKGVTFAPAPGTSGMDNPVEEVGDQFARAVKDYGDHLAQRHELYQQQLKQEATLLRSEQFRAALRTRPDAEQLVPGIEVSIRARSEAAAALDQEVREAIRKLVDTLGAL